jgi:hypothetical protein
MGKSLLYRMSSGIAGDVSRPAQSLIESATLNAAAAFAAYGLAGKFVGGKFVPLAGGETAADVRGFLVRPYPTQTANADGSGVQLGIVGNVMRRGYMTVVCGAGVPAKDGQAYARIAAPSAGKPLAGIEAVADGANTIAIAGCRFTGPADAAGNVEIEFNL